MVLLGVPAEARKHGELLRRAKSGVLSPEDEALILRIDKQRFYLKTLPTMYASLNTYFIPPLQALGPAIYTHTLVFFLAYRLATVLVDVNIEGKWKGISEKYELEKRTERVTPKYARSAESEWMDFLRGPGVWYVFLEGDKSKGEEDKWINVNVRFHSPPPNRPKPK
jgi:hypothetical protein